jgi:hypothetical protein
MTGFPDFEALDEPLLPAFARQIVEASGRSCQIKHAVSVFSLNLRG